MPCPIFWPTLIFCSAHSSSMVIAGFSSSSSWQRCNLDDHPQKIPKISREYWDYIRYIYIYGYGSIPINTIFNGMNIHLPAILMFTRGTRFWPIPIWVLAHCRLILDMSLICPPDQKYRDYSQTCHFPEIHYLCVPHISVVKFNIRLGLIWRKSYSNRKPWDCPTVPILPNIMITPRDFPKASNWLGSLVCFNIDLLSAKWLKVHPQTNRKVNHYYFSRICLFYL